MVYRKGELSKGTIDREWPHQVVLPAHRCMGHDYVTMRFSLPVQRLGTSVALSPFRNSEASAAKCGRLRDKWGAPIQAGIPNPRCVIIGNLGDQHLIRHPSPRTVWTLDRLL